MAAVAACLAMVTACVSIVATYALLNAENHRWQWASAAAGSSVSVYVFLYAAHYYFFRTHMSGLFQTAYFFGYSGMFCIALGLACGAIGHVAAAAFVRRIYRNVKCD